MKRAVISEQAKTIAALLPALMRNLFAGGDDAAAQLPLAQLRVCSVLCAGPQPMSAVSRELSVSLSAMTQISDRLERARLVQRVSNGDDRRIRCLQLTDRGEKMMRQREKTRVKRIEKVLGHLVPRKRKEVLDTLQTFIQASVAARGQKGGAKKRSRVHTSNKRPRRRAAVSR